MQEEILLNNVKAIAEKYEFLRKETGGDFNIFEIANIATREVTICRVLYDLLSPNGSHHQGDRYLRLFVENVLRLENCAENEWDKAKVYREYLIPSGRRIDLVIKTELRFIPIEVKIYADEQEKQCIDYWKYANAQQNNGQSVLYYLTRFGDEPGEYRQGKNATCNIACISFAKDILEWLSLCIKETDAWKLAPIREVIVQLMAAIRKFTGQMEDGEMEEIKNLLRNSPKYMKSAVALEKAIKLVSMDVMRDLFATIEHKIDEALPKVRKNEKWCYYNDGNTIEKFYDHSRSTFPGIAYYSDDVSENGAKICLKLEIDHKLFIGYGNTINDIHKHEKIVSQDTIEKLLQRLNSKDNPYRHAQYGSAFLVWQYVFLEETESPDFKNHNPAFYRLLDKEYFEKFTSKCADTMIELLKK